MFALLYRERHPKRVTPHPVVTPSEPMKREAEPPAVQPDADRIGYRPNDEFAQGRPYYYPYVLMPEPASRVQPSQSGRLCVRGRTEQAFEIHLRRYFEDTLHVLTDQYLAVDRLGRTYEPDFVLFDPSRNLHIDVEIDEPYDGLGDLPLHFDASNVPHDCFLTGRGWIVIRFAEIQVHQTPLGCCRILADVLQSIDPDYAVISDGLPDDAELPVLTPQWTLAQAQQWAQQQYRAQYLRSQPPVHPALAAAPYEAEADLPLAV